MPGQGVTLYALTAGGNKAIVGTIDWREDTYLPNQINDNLGQIMADIRAMANAIGTGWLEIGDGDGVYTVAYVAANQFQFTGLDVTPYYRVGMRVRVVAPTPGAVTGTITAVAFATHTLITVLWDSGSLSNEAITLVQIGIGSGDTTQPLTVGTSFRNILGRNGGLEVWQRGAGGSASFAVAAAGAQNTADGWYIYTNANQACTVSQQPGLTNGSRYCLRLQRNAGQTGVVGISFEYALDADEIAMVRGQFVTLSFTLRAGANFSGVITNATLFTGTGTPGRRGAGAYTGETTPISAGSIGLTGVASRFVYTSTVPLGALLTQGSLFFSWTPAGTAGAADYFEIDDVQLEAGMAATPFERRPFATELAACQRRFWKSFKYDTAPAQNVNAGGGGGVTGEVYWTSLGPSTRHGVHVAFPVLMRSAPTIVLYNPSAANQVARDMTTNTDCVAMLIQANPTERQVHPTAVTPAGSGLGGLVALHLTADAEL